VQVLQNNGVTPVVVFDGGKLKQKKGVEKDRSEHRERAKQEALKYLEKGNEEMAIRKFSESLDITP